jgi:hypothetical protein
MAVNGSKTRSLFVQKIPAEQPQTPLQTGIAPAPAPGAGRT